MRSILLRLLLIIFFCGCKQNERASTVVTRDSIVKEMSYIIKNVNLIPMTYDTIIKSQHVLISNGIIKKIFTSNKIGKNKDYYIIDGSGKFLMPGLADMHTHIRKEEELKLNILNGVTTVLDLGGRPGILELKSKVDQKLILGPQIFASVYIDGVEPTYWLADGSESPRLAIERFKNQGFDFIKVYNEVSSKSFYELIKEGNKLGMPVIGHGVRSVGIEKGIMSGQKMVAHAEEYLYAHFNDNRSNDEVIKIAKTTYDSGAYVTANLSTFSVINNQWGERSESFIKTTLQRPEIKYLPEETVESWKKSKRYANRSGSLDENLKFLQSFTYSLYKSGVPLLAGTDSPSPDIVGMIPGFSMHDELESYSKIGLSNYEVLKTATKNPGEFISKNLKLKTPFGIIKEGYRADLILLEKNPLDNLNNIKQISGLFLNGKYLEAKDL